MQLAKIRFLYENAAYHLSLRRFSAFFFIVLVQVVKSESQSNKYIGKILIQYISV